MTARLLPYGPGGWLVEMPEADVVGYAAAVRHRADPDVTEIVPAARTVLVRLRDGAARDTVRDWLAGLEPDREAAGERGVHVDIPVVYDGDDLEAVASASGLAVTDVVARHTAPTYVCGFCGFAPGFAYLTGLDERLVLARRTTPRTRVPAGSVAIASGYTAVYPSPSPGGWHLIGRTDATLWDPGRDRPALVAPGTTVRFVAVDR